MPNKANLLFKLVLSAILGVSVLAATASANPVIPVPTSPNRPMYTPSVPKVGASGYILLDVNSGRILAEKNADERLPPASLTKIMTVYIVSGALQSGHIRLDDKVRVSENAWRTEGSRMFLKVNEEVPVKKLLEGIIVASGNDASVAIAEHIAGTEDGFADMMNQQASILGMKDTHFTDSTGLPDPNHYSTARDLATLTRAYIMNFPEDYSYHGEKWFSYNGIKQPNRNRLLWRYQYADGLKTGHTKEAGFCLVSSAKKDGMRLVAVVLGEPSDNARTEDSIRLLSYGFRFYETHKAYNAGSPLVQARVWKGKSADLPLGVSSDFYVTVPTGQYKRLKATLNLNKTITAPIKKGDTCGTLDIVYNNEVIASKPLIALEPVAKGGLLRRAADSVRMNIHKYISKSDNEAVNTG